MVKADMDMIMGGDNLVAEQGEGAAYVVRVSRTAGGVRTWTVGATLADMARSGEVVANVLALDDALLIATMAPPAGDPIPTKVPDKPTAKADKPTPTATLGRQLKLSLLAGRLEREFHWVQQNGLTWVSVSDIMGVLGIPASGRSRLIKDLHELVRAGLLEYRPSGGGRGRASMYHYIGGRKVMPTPAGPAVELTVVQ